MMMPPILNPQERPLSQIPISQPDMLSPLLSQPIERNSSPVNITPNSPISNALNLAASAASLKKDFVICEQIMTEKHKFLVDMLDGMNNKVSSIAEKLASLENRVQVLEESGNTKTLIAQSIFQAANERHNDMERKQRENDAALTRIHQKCDKMENMYTRITKIEQLLMERKEPEKSTTNVNLDIAIYGLYTPNDITISVDRLFEDMNQSNVKCVFAYRTPSRPDSNRPGVVMAVMRCLQDKRAILEHKRSIRHIPQYQNVYIKSSKTHTEQVMDANFSLMLNEMTNGSSYFISDNGRIRKKTREQHNQHNSYDTFRYNERDGYRGLEHNHSGARPKTNQNPILDYRRQTNKNQNYSDHLYPSRHNQSNMTYSINNIQRRQGIWRQNDRSTLNSNNYCRYGSQTHHDHTKYGPYTHQYNMNRYDNNNPLFYQINNDANYAVDHIISKN